MTSETVEAIRVALDRFSLARSPPRRVLLAVSGGPDSLALLLAFAGRSLPVEVSVATVDHGLRPESAGEAAFVAGICRDLGLPHGTLRWEAAASVRGNLMDAAREARYGLLGREAARIGADAVLTAHHADDQIETHFLARARGATGANLAGMRAWRDLQPGLVLLRPFLTRPKRLLEEAVEREGLALVHDPTNSDARFRRAQFRRELANGLHDAPALAEALAAAGRLREAEDAALAAAIDRACAEGRLSVDRNGSATFRPDGEPAALWSRLLTAVGGALRPPEGAAIGRLVAQVSAGDGAVATLGGCRVERGEGAFHVRREFGRKGPERVEIVPGEAACFDRRFDLSGPFPPGAVALVPLGRLGRGSRDQKTLPVCVDAHADVVGVHPALRGRFADMAPLAVRQRVGWRISADLPGSAPSRLTAEPQIAANPVKAVGKDLAATYLRGRV